jgi:tetratricopeptide (TPR) repeat protein
VTPRLAALVRRKLIRPDRTQLAADDAFRFCHVLIRDAAYEALPKASRADLHERFAVWLEKKGTELVELDEILGYHLEQAAQYRLELGRPAAELAARAARLLGAAGLRALDRDDAHAAANLLSRAIDLVGPDDPAHVPLLSALAEAVYGLGELERCHELLAAAIERGIALGQNGAVARARIFSAYLHGHSDTETSSLLEEVDRTLAELRGAGDDENLARAHTVRGWLCFWVGRADESTEEARRAIEHAVRAASPSLEAKAVALLVAGMRAGRTPWSELERFIDGRLAGAGGRLGRRPDGGLLEGRGAALAARGEFDAARQVYDELRQTSVEYGMLLSAVTLLAQQSAEVELLAREWTAAESILREAWDELGAAGEGGFRSTTGTMLATALVAQGRLDEAAVLVAECELITSRDDFLTHASVELIRARIASALARHDEAVDHARASLEILGPTDFLETKADAHIVLGEALLAAGRLSEAGVALEKAEAHALQKGSLVIAADARALLDRIEQTIG